MTLRLPIYLDYMATTPVDPRVAKKMAQCLEISGNFGNPASVTHSYGWRAKEAVELARQQLADLIRVDPKTIVWTSGATESINLALKGAAQFYQRRGKHIITCQTEHKAGLDTCRYLARQGFEITYLPTQQDGLIDLDQLKSAMRADTILVSIMHVNNEIGVIQDIKAMGELTRPRGVLFHVDAAQSLGKIPIDLSQLSVDLMSFSGHKIYGPKGVGALYIRDKPRLHLEPLIHGGGHEHGLRSGTLPTHQIVGMGEACVIAQSAMVEENARILKMRERLWQGIKCVANVSVNGSLTHRVSGNLNVSFCGVDATTLLAALQDLAVSTGSACTSANVEPSHVLLALGVSAQLAQSTLRFSMGRFTLDEEIDYVIRQIQEKIR